MDSVVCFVNTYPLDSDLSGGQRYPAFEQPGPEDNSNDSINIAFSTFASTPKAVLNHFRISHTVPLSLLIKCLVTKVRANEPKCVILLRNRQE